MSEPQSQRGTSSSTSSSTSLSKSRHKKNKASTYSISSTKQKLLQKRKERRKLQREQKLERGTTLEIIPGYQQGHILGKGSFGSVWTLVPDNVRETKETKQMKETKETNEKNVTVIATTTTTTTTTITQTTNNLNPLHNKNNVTDNWILKVSSMQRDRDGRLKDTFDREVFYLKHLANVSPKMTPTLLHARIIDKNGLQIMERFDDTVKMLGVNQARTLNIPGRTSQAFTWKQLTRIIELARQLDFMGIVHGDLKHSNMLFRWKDTTKNPNNVEICVCDFGFSGTLSGEHYYPLIGFMRHYGCNPKRTIHYGSATKSDKNVYAGGILQPRFKLQSPVPQTLLPVLNRCQLYIALAEQTRLYLWHQKTFVRMRPPELLQMMNLDTKDIVETLKQYCPRIRTLPAQSYLSKLFFPLDKTRYEFGSRQAVVIKPIQAMKPPKSIKNTQPCHHRLMQKQTTPQLQHTKRAVPAQQKEKKKPIDKTMH